MRQDRDGVPSFFVEGPEPYRVWLQFRVGRADEALPTAGLTHLCEHLALVGCSARSFNGSVQLNSTTFWVQGTADEARTFLADLCRRLARLPVDRLEREKSVLRVESGERKRSIVDAMLFDRFGARTYGLAALPELGLPNADADAVHDWAGRWFTRDNVVACVVGPAPLALELALPAGTRVPPPAATSRALPFPAAARHPGRVVGTGGVLPRSGAAMLALAVMTARLRRVLREELGSAYHVRPVYFALTARDAYVSMTSELAETRTDHAARAFLRTLEDVAAHGPTAAELEAERANTLAAGNGEGRRTSAAHAAALDELFGASPTTWSAMWDEYRRVSPDDVRTHAAELLRGAFHQVPPDLDVPLDGITDMASWRTPRFDGAEYADLPGVRGRPERLVAGEDGLTLWIAEDARSVPWDDVAGLLWWADGGRQIVGNDGSRITIAPTRVRNGRTLVADVDARIPSSLRIRVGKRSGIPFRPAVRRGPGAGKRWTLQRRVTPVLLVLLVSITGSLLRSTAPGRGPIVALAVVAAVAVGLALRRHRELSVGGGDGTELYDTAAAHEQRLPPNVPRNRIYTRGGHLLAYLALHDFCSPWFTKESGHLLDRLRRREITGPELYEEWDGVLASDMLSDAGNEFVFDLLGFHPKPSRYDRALDALAPADAPGGPPPGWGTYDRVAPALDAALARWRRFRTWYRIRRYVERPPSF